MIPEARYVELGPPTINSDTNRGPSQGRPGSYNCYPYQGNTILCMSSLGHRPTAGLVRGGLEVAIVILTRGIPYFVCRVWATDYKFRHLAAATLKRDTRPILPIFFGFVAQVVWCPGGQHPETGFGAHTVQILWICGRLWKLL